MIGDRIKEARVEANMTQGELAKKADITRCAVNKIERNHIQNIKARTAHSLAKALGVSVDFLLCDE